MGMRERYQAKPRPGVPIRFRVDNPREPERLLNEAVIALRLAQARTADAATIDALTAKADRARQAVDACFEEIWLQAVEPDDLEVLIREHPPRADTDDDSWNAATFPRALFVAGAPDDMTADEWNVWLDKNCGDAEREAYLYAALRVNMRAPSEALPKGWTQNPG